MNALLKIFQWGDENRPRWLDYLRIALGAFLFIKSLDLMFNIGVIQTLPGGYDTAMRYYVLLQTVIYAHLVFGAFIAVGLLTRWASAIQIPILLGAIFLANNPRGPLLLGDPKEMTISIVILLLVIVFMVFGAGRLSMDGWRKTKKQTRKDKDSGYSEVSMS